MSTGAQTNPVGSEESAFKNVLFAPTASLDGVFTDVAARMSPFASNSVLLVEFSTATAGKVRTWKTSPAEAPEERVMVSPSLAV